MDRSSLQRAYDDDQRFFASNSDRRHRARPAEPSEVAEVRVSSPECVVDGDLGWAWFAMVRLECRSPWFCSVFYIRGPRHLDVNGAQDEVIARFLRLLSDHAARVLRVGDLQTIPARAP